MEFCHRRTSISTHQLSKPCSNSMPYFKFVFNLFGANASISCPHTTILNSQWRRVKNWFPHRTIIEIIENNINQLNSFTTLNEVRIYTWVQQFNCLLTKISFLTIGDCREYVCWSLSGAFNLWLMFPIFFNTLLFIECQ